jgi:ABC-type multidrug transport system fused ATPase/permease subunit
MNVLAIRGRRQRRLLAALVANGLGQTVSEVGKILLIRLAFDRLVGAPDSVPMTLWAGVGLGLAATAAGSAWLEMREHVDSERLGQAQVYRVRLALFDRLRSLSPRSLQRRGQGSILLRFVGDLSALRLWVSRGLARGAVAAILALGGLAALAVLSLPLAGAVAVVVGGGTVLALGKGRRMRKTVREARRRRARLATNVHEKVHSMAVVQVFDQTERERRRMARQSRRLEQAMVDRARASGLLRGLGGATTAAAVAGVLLLGAGEVAAGRATHGTVVAAMLIGRLLVRPLRTLGRVYERWQDARVAEEKIRQFLATPSRLVEVSGARDVPPGPGRLTFEDVRLGGALRGLSAEVKPGSVVALVGPNGAGKSSLLALVARLVDPDGGAILLDGHDLARHRLASVRRRVGMVSPDLPLLRGSVERNLRYRWPRAPREALERVTALCGVDEVVEGLPRGLATRLTDGGVNLSVGQRQRIALARALLGDPDILLLDEPDANLDPASCATLERVLESYRGTVLWVTHRARRLAAADVVWYLESGRLIETGSPGALVAGGGPTARFLGTADPVVARAS